MSFDCDYNKFSPQIKRKT